MSRLTGALHGPYARQVIQRRLKYWFAFVPDEGDIGRYEVIFDREFRHGKARHRPAFPGGVPTHSSAFTAYAIPPDLKTYPCVSIDRGERIADRARTLLSDEDRADIVRLTLTGEPPRNHAPEGILR